MNATPQTTAPDPAEPDVLAADPPLHYLAERPATPMGAEPAGILRWTAAAATAWTLQTRADLRELGGSIAPGDIDAAHAALLAAERELKALAEKPPTRAGAGADPASA